MRIIFGEIRYAALFCFLTLVPAQTLAWPRAWILIGVGFVVRTVGAFAVQRANPDLWVERSKTPIHRDQPAADKFLLPAFMAALAALIAACSFDRFHLHLFAEPSLAVSVAGLIAVIAGWSLVCIALRTNAFATTVVRHQPERDHTVVDSGVYSIVRHPMYSGLLPVMIGLSLWLGSIAGVLFSLIPLAILVIRIVFEERLLRTSLPGYIEYSRKVRYRLIPFIW